jgi:hypothetical protein
VVTGARSPRRRLAGAWRSSLRIDLGCMTASAKGRGDRAIAHLGSDGPEKRRRTAGVDDRRQRTDDVGEEARRGRLKASGSTVLLEEVLRSWWRGQHGLRCTGGLQLLGGGLTSCDASGPNPASARAEDANRGSGVDPVLGAELLQWSRAAGMHWNDRPTAEPKLVRRSGSWWWH